MTPDNAQLAPVDDDVIDGVIVQPPQPTLADYMRGINEAIRTLAKGLTQAFALTQNRFHLMPCHRRARCRVCNPRGNPPPAPHTAGYRRRTRHR